MKSASTQFSSALTIDDLSKVDYELLRKVIEAIGPKLLNKVKSVLNLKNFLLNDLKIAS